ncbi:hypothetical protein N7532_003147 [Penicillium argentinense]|uniref:Uncharacterized protein n=1 Tax=Penicillium argentinense TaxID=1131581 RepID=A0A9W9FM08_9EURO|nr:uncharacterized protein N7532_003147 [Penicillium argentinense]KAJ5102618.1 hypothetical protein N7532_003147 [Penicillium argentinense]
MATPPPEAAPPLKEEKPQLPPSPAGASAPDQVHPSGQNAGTDLKTESTASAPALAPATDNDAPKTNGHSPSVPPKTNGASAAASPPKSLASVSTEPKPNAEPSEHNEIKKPEETPAPAEPQPAAPSVAESTPADNIVPPADVSTSHSTDGHAAGSVNGGVKEATSGPALNAVNGGMNAGETDAGDDKMAIDSPNLSSAVTQLPHHPTTDISTTSLPQNTDTEMKDAPSAPMSPSKQSRQREADPAEEPASKRTKVENEGSAAVNIKLPEVPSASAETSRSKPTGGEARITKMQQKFIQKSLTSLKRMHDSRFYREPVDYIKLNIPNYPSVITKPMDLGTIERKLKANEYPTAQAVFDDFDLMVANSLRFNGADHLVYQEGEKLKHTFHKQMTNLPKEDEVEEKKPKKTAEKTSAARREPRTSLGSTTAKAASPQATTFALGPEGLPVIRRDSTNPDGRPKRSIHPPKRDLPYASKPKKKKYQWELRFCQETIEELFKPKHQINAIPFYAPVDPVALNIPTYHSIIKKPMDMGTIKSKLTTGQYENSKEFEADVRLMFKNCYRFNLPGDPTYLAGKQLEEVFDQKWQHKQEYLDRHEPHPEHNSDSSDDDSDDGESDEDDNEQLTELQRKIAEMSRQVEMITQKKMKTPPASKKSGSKAKGTKKEPKKSGSKKEKKSTKAAAKPEKTRFVSYNEKQMISNGISTLPDKKMQQALQIIQNNVPNLKVYISQTQMTVFRRGRLTTFAHHRSTFKGAQEAEIELDIDELPNDVLLLLLKFVKKHAPNLEDDEEDVPMNNNVSAAKPKKNKPMSKFEQEAQINMLESNLSRFQGGHGGSPDPMPSVEANESSEDESDDDSEESEEE